MKIKEKYNGEMYIYHLKYFRQRQMTNTKAW